jgi:hypothetical protein
MQIGDCYETQYTKYTIISKFLHPITQREYIVIQNKDNLFNVSVVLDKDFKKEDKNG